jgi:hypothetical protein
VVPWWAGADRAAKTVLELEWSSPTRSPTYRKRLNLGIWLGLAPWRTAYKAGRTGYWMGNGTVPCSTPLAFFAPHRGTPKACGTSRSHPHPPNPARCRTCATPPRGPSRCCSRHRGEEGENAGAAEREEDGAGDVDGEERRRREGDGGAPANQLGAACSSRRRPGKGATCSVAHPHHRGPLLRRMSSMAWR